MSVCTSLRFWFETGLVRLPQPAPSLKRKKLPPSPQVLPTLPTPTAAAAPLHPHQQLDRSLGQPHSGGAKAESYISWFQRDPHLVAGTFTTLPVLCCIPLYFPRRRPNLPDCCFAPTLCPPLPPPCLVKN